MLDETGFYAPSMAHTPCPAVMAGHFCVFKHNPTVSKPLRYSLTRECTVPHGRAAVPDFRPSCCGSITTRVKSSNAFARVLRSTSSGVVPLISAIFDITYGMFDESFLVPRCGSGAMYGQSVSRRILPMEALTLSVPASLHS